MTPTTLPPTLLPTNNPIACAAPPLTDELLAAYDKLIKGLPAGPVRGALEACYACVLAWWNLPVSTKKHNGTTYRLTQDRGYNIIPLEDAHIKSLDATTPWDYECHAMRELFETLPKGVTEIPATPDAPAYNKLTDQAAHNLCNAAFHLLWHCLEITKDREPITQDKLIPV